MLLIIKPIIMKIFYLSIILLTTIFTNCSSQQKLDINKHRSDLFLKWILKNREEKIVSTKPIQLSMGTLWRMKDDIKFSKKDSLSMRQQIEINNKIFFDSSLAPNKLFLEKIESGYTYLKISKPIFFSNGKKLWINLENHCPDTCGEGFIEVYEVNKSGYKLLLKISTWIS